MDRSAMAARILKTDGVLLLVVALIHFAATPFALHFVSSQSTPEAFVQIGPPFLLSFIVVGILLVPIGLSTVYSADSFRRGERWAWAICCPALTAASLAFVRSNFCMRPSLADVWSERAASEVDCEACSRSWAARS